MAIGHGRLVSFEVLDRDFTRTDDAIEDLHHPEVFVRKRLIKRFPFVSRQYSLFQFWQSPFSLQDPTNRMFARACRLGLLPHTR
jgi:hypothetical protein